MRLRQLERKRLNYILRELTLIKDVNTKAMIVCPFPDRECEYTCGTLFPVLINLIDHNGHLPCPCFAIIDGHIKLEDAIEKVREVLEQGEIREE